MTIEFKTVSKPMLEDLIGCVEQTLAETESSDGIMEYASATGKCRGTLTTVLSILHMYADDEMFSLN